MAKKTRRPNLPQETLERARRELAQSGVIEITETPKGAVESAQPAVVKPKRVFVSHTDLRTEYAYVMNDLRNMAMLAATFLVVLVALSFVI
jgi:hypothetical protein